jgi:hypothetical protein
MIKVRHRCPFVKRFKNGWPVFEFIKILLKSRRRYGRKLRTLGRTSPAHSFPSPSENSDRDPTRTPDGNDNHGALDEDAALSDDDAE